MRHISNLPLQLSSHWPSLEPSDHNHIKTKDQEDIDFHPREFSSLNFLNLNHHSHETEPQQLLCYVLVLALHCCWPQLAVTSFVWVLDTTTDTQMTSCTWKHVACQYWCWHPRLRHWACWYPLPLVIFGTIPTHPHARRRGSVDSCSCKSCKEQQLGNTTNTTFGDTSTYSYRQQQEQPAPAQTLMAPTFEGFHGQSLLHQ